MPNFGFIIVVLFIALLVMGPEKAIPMARSMGKFMRGFRNITQNITTDLSKAMDLDGETTPTGGLKDLAQGLKSDFDKILSSVDQSVGEARSSLMSQKTEIIDSLTRDTQELKKILATESKLVAGSISANLAEAKTELDRQAKEMEQSIKSIAPDSATPAPEIAQSINSVAPESATPALESEKTDGLTSQTVVEPDEPVQIAREEN